MVKSHGQGLWRENLTSISKILVSVCLISASIRPLRASVDERVKVESEATWNDTILPAVLKNLAWWEAVW